MNTIFFARERAIYFVAIVISLLLSLWITMQGTVVNPDGICYLLSAEAVGTSGISKAMHLCSQAHWPFYSILIYYFSFITHLSLTAAAQVLNAFFSLISVVTFIAIVKELGGSKRVLWLAALVILSAHTFNELRNQIIRDHGFWAFYLISLLMLLQYFRLSNIAYAFAWSFSLLIATLFRIEGIFFLVGLPCIAWLRTNLSWRQRATMFLTLNAPLLFAITIACIYCLFNTSPIADDTNRASELITQFQNAWSQFSLRFETTKTVLAQQAALGNSIHDVAFVVLFAIAASYILNVLSCLSWIFVLVLIYAWHRKVISFAANARLVLLAYIVINVIVTSGFFAEAFFLSQRYVVALTLVLMCWLPFALNHIIQLWPVSQRHKEMITLTLLAMVITAFTSIVNLHSKFYLREAGDWLAQNVPANSSLYVNDYQVMYYSHHFGNGIFDKYKAYSDLNSLSKTQWKQFQYLALHLSNANDAGMQGVLEEINILPIKIFSNKRGDKVVIYKIA